ncbi:ABC transporter permease, partial [Mesorhizobium sp. M00.F.Ca.ET.038.03.1.1]
MKNQWTWYDPRLAWMLIAPVLLLLIFFLVLPIAVM